ncbi:MAG: LPS export ABC transporter periplasmic protein LptC [Calditrichae bacterium]|nr:LPS export ABC transporter periplasmic protein LptC [Calditrichota bacterium]MCB9057320.1 LPS export ABC transporter periplasmic protein LptC [Calditrichia bacterium]
MKELIILLLLFFIFACSTKESESVESGTELDYPDQESWNTVLTITNQGNKMGVVVASHLKKYSSKNLTLISDGLKVDFYNAQGRHTSVLTSEGGRVHDVKQDMIAYGNVVVVSDSGMTLYTDTLRWDNERQKIISEIPVTIISETDTLYGDSFISDPGLENYEITNSRGTGSNLLRKKS